MIIASANFKVVIGMLLLGFLRVVTSLLVLFFYFLFMVIEVEAIDVSSLNSLEILLKDHDRKMLVDDEFSIRRRNIAIIIESIIPIFVVLLDGFLVLFIDAGLD